jgi:hypothetical protein
MTARAYQVASELMPRSLGADTAEALTAIVAGLKARGATQAQLAAAFGVDGVTVTVYRAALAGGVISAEARGSLIALSFDGILAARLANGGPR